MDRNIIICCDGTDNMLTINENTNVLYIYSCLKKNDSQVTYYNPGVGTLVPETIKGKIWRWCYNKIDLASAKSLHNNVKNAYIFLMNNYEDGDKIFLFGFSRGAYTVRMLCGIINMYGLLYKGNENHLNYILEIYFKLKEKFHVSNLFKSNFSRVITIEFLGVFDTVVSVGGIIKPERSFPYTRSLDNVKIVRHAISIDERRKQYHCQKIGKPSPNSDFKEVYFAGVHSDIGGSYPEQGLSKITLEWMLGEASNSGLKLNIEKVKLLIDENEDKELNIKQPIHNSMTFWWLLAEVIPRNALKFLNNKFVSKLDLSFNQPRKIPNDAKIHFSVFEKLSLEGNESYSPKNINRELEYQTVNNQKIVFV